MHTPRHAPVLRLLGAVALAVAPPLAAQRPDSARATPAPPPGPAADTARVPVARPVAPYRDPRRARVLGTVLPGAGHVYAGEYFTGYVLWASAVTGLLLGPLTYQLDSCTSPFSGHYLDFLEGRTCTPRAPRWPYRAAGVLLTAGGAAAWVMSALDAPRGAERANARHRRARVAPLIAPPAGPGGGAALGVAVQWR